MELAAMIPCPSGPRSLASWTGILSGDTCWDVCCDGRPGWVTVCLFIFALKFQQRACLLGEILEARIRDACCRL